MSNQTKKSTKLTLTDIKNENKIYSQKQRVELSSGNHLFIYPHFSNTKLSELIKEILTDKQRAEAVGIKFDEINMGDWAIFNVIYKFADLGIPSQIEKKVQAFYELVDYKCYGEIIEAFPKESIDKFKKALDNFSSNLEVLMKENGIDIDKAIEETLTTETDIVE